MTNVISSEPKNIGLMRTATFEGGCLDGIQRTVNMRAGGQPPAVYIAQKYGGIEWYWLHKTSPLTYLSRPRTLFTLDPRDTPFLGETLEGADG